MSSYKYYLFYKPFKVLSQFTDPVGGKQTLGNYHNFPKDVYPIGRLDEDSEGLLMLSSDPSLTQKMLGQGVEKEYWVQVEGIPTEEALESLRKGVEIRVRKKLHLTLAARVKQISPPPIPERNPPVRFRKNIPTSWISIVLREGKNRQVRRMTAKVGFPTLRLLRYRVGKMTLAKMQPGEYKEIPNPQK